MNTRLLRVSGILFFIAGAGLLAAAIFGKRSGDLAIGCAAIAIGAALVARSRKANPGSPER